MTTGCKSTRQYYSAITKHNKLVIDKTAIPDSGQLIVAFDNHAIALTRQDDNQFLALYTSCTLMECAIDINGSRFVFSWHGVAFNNTGEFIKGPQIDP